MAPHGFIGTSSLTPIVRDTDSSIVAAIRALARCTGEHTGKEVGILSMAFCHPSVIFHPLQSGLKQFLINDRGNINLEPIRSRRRYHLRGVTVWHRYPL